jgi:ABC-2 type transport system ATP-binding protein
MLRPVRADRYIQALRNVNLRVRPGEIYGLVGPNGAGKTTLIKILATLLHPDSGEARLFGLDVVRNEFEIKRRIGYVMGEERSFYWRLSGFDNLRFFAALDDLMGRNAHARILEVLHLVGLGDEARRPFRQFSSGMRQKLAIARALLTDPEILLMDEPTRSLDPESAAVVRDIMRRMARDQGRTVLFATHNLEEAGEVSSRIGMMFGGRIQSEGTPAEIRSLAGTGVSYEICFKEKDPQALETLKTLEAVVNVTAESETCVQIELKDADVDISSVMRKLLDSGCKLESFSRRERDLGAVFAELARKDS